MKMFKIPEEVNVTRWYDDGYMYFTFSYNGKEATFKISDFEMYISDTMFGNYEVINDRIMNALKEVGYDE